MPEDKKEEVKKEFDVESLNKQIESKISSSIQDGMNNISNKIDETLNSKLVEKTKEDDFDFSLDSEDDEPITKKDLLNFQKNMKNDFMKEAKKISENTAERFFRLRSPNSISARPTPFP